MLAAINHLRSRGYVRVPVADANFEDQATEFARVSAEQIFGNPPSIVIAVSFMRCI
jgi:hypothetical protein